MVSNKFLSISTAAFLTNRLSRCARFSSKCTTKLESDVKLDGVRAINTSPRNLPLENKPASSWLERTTNWNKGPQINYVAKRFKKTKGKGRGKAASEDDEEEDDDDDSENENPLLMDDLTDQAADGCQRTTIDVGSLRLDAVGKMAFGVTRYKMEELFYKGDLYINGERAAKKSQDLHLGDEIDLIKGVNPEDRTKLDAKRIQIVSMPDKATEQGRMKITIDRWMDIVIDMPDKKE